MRKSVNMSGLASTDALNDLLPEVARRNIAAFRKLYDASLPRLRTLARALMRDADLADDVLQQAYVRIWESAATFDARRGSAISWMQQLCRNIAFDEFRRRKARLSRDTRYAEASMIDGSYQRAEEFSVMTARLNASEQALLAEIFVEGWSFAEVAARKGLPLGTAKSRVRRALAKLRQTETPAP